MSVHTRFAIEYPSNAPHTSIPIPTLAQTAPSIPEESTEIRTSFPSLWKGIWDFAIGIFKSKTRRALEEKNQILDEENKKLEERMQTLQEDNQRLGDKRKRLKEEVALVKVKIAEVSKMGERTEGWLEVEVDRGTRRMEAVLKSQMDELHEKRMSELQVFKEIFERHEEVGDGLQIYKQGFEEAKQERDAVKQCLSGLTERNEELVHLKKELQDFLNEEKDKVAMYETFYGVLGNSSNWQ